jgi:hypothetical protein
LNCNDNITEPAQEQIQPDTEKPTVAILYPATGSELKVDTIYTLISDAEDNKEVSRVEFYVDETKVGMAEEAPYESKWSTRGKSGNHTIMARAYDWSRNIGQSSSVTIKFNNAPAAPTNPVPADDATGLPTSLLLSWDCSDPDGGVLMYDVYFGENDNPNMAISTDQTALSINPTGLTNSTRYYWKVAAKDGKGGTTVGPVWSFTTNKPPAIPSNRSRHL